LFVAVAVLVVIAAIAAIAGTFETRRRPLGSAVIAAAGILGCIAVLSRQGATALDTIPTVVGACFGGGAPRPPPPRVPRRGPAPPPVRAARPGRWGRLRRAGRRQAQDVHLRIARIRNREWRGGCLHHAVGAFGGGRSPGAHIAPSAHIGAANTSRCATERRC